MALEFVVWKEGGPRYKTRDGSTAILLQQGCIGDGDGGLIPVWDGRCDKVWQQWDQNGKEINGNAELDLVGYANENQCAPGANWK